MKYLTVQERLIVFEGIDGAGKSTQVNLVAQALKKSMKVAVTNAPYTGVVGTFIRKILKEKSFACYRPTDVPYMSAAILSHLFAADRFEHLYSQNGVFSQLDTHDIVLCDRYFFSSIAYQGSLQLKKMTTLINSEFPLPQVLIYFQLSPQVAMKRIQLKDKDYLETLDILQDAHSRYEQLLQEYELAFSHATHPHAHTMRIIRLDATKPQEVLTAEILQHLHAILT